MIHHITDPRRQTRDHNMPISTSQRSPAWHALRKRSASNPENEGLSTDQIDALADIGEAALIMTTLLMELCKQTQTTSAAMFKMNEALMMAVSAVRDGLIDEEWIAEGSRGRFETDGGDEGAPC